KAAEPGHCEPGQRCCLKRKAKTECGLIGRDRIVSVLRRPLLDHESGDAHESDSSGRRSRQRRMKAPSYCGCGMTRIFKGRLKGTSRLCDLDCAELLDADTRRRR